MALDSLRYVTLDILDVNLRFYPGAQVTPRRLRIIPGEGLFVSHILF